MNLSIRIIFVILCSVGVAVTFEMCQEYVVEGPHSNIYTTFFKLNRFENNNPDDPLVGWNAPEIFRLRFLVLGTSDAKLWLNRYADEEEIELGKIIFIFRKRCNTVYISQ